MKLLTMLLLLIVLLASVFCAQRRFAAAVGRGPRETAGPNGIADHETASGVHEGWRHSDHDQAFRDDTADSGDPFLAEKTR